MMINRLNRKFIIAVAIIMLVIMVVVFVFLNRQFMRSAEQEILLSYGREIHQIAANLDKCTDSVSDTMLSLLCDTRLKETINRPIEKETLENQLSEIRMLREVVSYVENSRYIDRMRLYLSDEKMITREHVNFFPHTDAIKTPEYVEMSERRKSMHWMGQHKVHTPYKEEDYITLGLIYRANFIAESRNWALILLDISPKEFSNSLLQASNSYTDAQVFIIDGAGNVMAGNADDKLLNAFTHKNEMLGFFNLNGKEYAYIQQPLDVEDWSIAVTLPRKNLRNSQQTLLTAIRFVLGILIIALTALICVVLYSVFVRRYIHTLNENLKHSGGEKLTNTPSHIALFNLDRNIEHLLETNRNLASAKLEAQLRERDVTLQALQAQINPHFLYNTLDAINWMAINEHATDASEAITTLADYFRLSLSHGKSIVTLKKDVEITKKYLDLHKHRYDYIYSVEWKLQPQSLNCLIPKLTLQPLVENALQHGIFMREEKQGGKIIIRSLLENGQLVISVQDNGPGVKNSSDNKKGFGLENVRKRLDLYYNNSYSLDLVSLSSGGAQVTVRIKSNKLKMIR